MCVNNAGRVGVQKVVPFCPHFCFYFVFLRSYKIKDGKCYEPCEFENYRFQTPNYPYLYQEEAKRLATNKLRMF